MIFVKSKALKLILFFIWVLLAGCDAKLSRLDFALAVSGDNRNELDRVLEHYKDDSLKYQAAIFLIENMPYHYGWEHEDTMHLHAYYHALQGSSVPAEQIYDSISKICGVYDNSKRKKVIDIETVKSDFLIDHIDSMFEMWKTRPWRKDISFHTFCHHILPYRLRDEPLQPWARDLFSKYDCLLDSIRQTPDSADIKKAATIVLDHFLNQQIHFTHSVPQGVNVGVGNVNWKTGDCKEFADILTWVLRSLGIPSGSDSMLVRGDNNVPHYWNYIIDNNGISWFGSITYDSGFKKTDTYWNPKGKVWRECFALNEELQSHLLETSDMEDIYPLFRTPLIEDVTPLYANPNLLTVKIENNRLTRIPDENQIVYMCLSLRDRWIPVGIADRKDKHIDLTDIEGDVVFRLATSQGSQISFISEPFLVDRKTGEVKWFDVADKRNIQVHILHKFNLRTEPFGTNMMGGVFEGSSHLDFSGADTLHIISHYPDRLYNRIHIKSNNKYKYLRYKSPIDGYCDIAEIWVYDEKGNEIKGDALGSVNYDSYWSGFKAENVFDGNTDTSFHFEKPDGGWVGLKFYKPAQISKIVYTPRNRKNFIQPGDTYELFYCDGEWKSAGKITAVSDSLLFNVPEKTLLYMKNSSFGFKNLSIS